MIHAWRLQYRQENQAQQAPSVPAPHATGIGEGRRETLGGRRIRVVFTEAEGKALYAKGYVLLDCGVQALTVHNVQMCKIILENSSISDVSVIKPEEIILQEHGKTCTFAG